MTVWISITQKRVTREKERKKRKKKKGRNSAYTFLVFISHIPSRIA